MNTTATVKVLTASTTPKAKRRFLNGREKNDALRRIRTGELYKTIANDLGCSIDTISRIAKANGNRRKRPFTKKPKGSTTAAAKAKPPVVPDFNSPDMRVIATIEIALRDVMTLMNVPGVGTVVVSPA